MHELDGVNLLPDDARVGLLTERHKRHDARAWCLPYTAKQYDRELRTELDRQVMRYDTVTGTAGACS
eukprot:17776-Heterococcus_DN1.PRE.4